MIKLKLIFIVDKGHRQDTPGKRANGLLEWEFNDDVGNRLKAKFAPYGEVYFTIDTPNHPYTEMTAEGRTKNLQYRCNIANQIYYEAKNKYGNGFKIIFISVHANAYSDPAASGYEIFAYKFGTQAHELAKLIHESAKEILGVGIGIKDRKIKEANFYVLVNTKMPAVLVEHEFYTNLEAVKGLKDNTFRDKCAEHILKGALKYMGVEYIESKREDTRVDLPFVLHGRDKSLKAILYQQSYHVSIRTILEMLGYKVEYKDGKVYAEYKEE